MATKGGYYTVKSVPRGVSRSLPLRDVKPGTRVKLLEMAPKGSLDVVDVKVLSTGKIKSVYSFQLS